MSHFPWGEGPRTRVEHEMRKLGVEGLISIVKMMTRWLEYSNWNIPEEEFMRMITGAKVHDQVAGLHRRITAFDRDPEAFFASAVRRSKAAKAAARRRKAAAAKARKEAR